MTKKLKFLCDTKGYNDQLLERLGGSQGFLPQAIDEDSLNSEKNYYIPLSMEKPGFSISFSCSPPTPVSEIEGYTRNVESFNGDFKSIVSHIGYNPKDFRMGEFARKHNAYVSYLGELNKVSFCIGDSNRDAFNALNSKISQTDGNNQTARQMFEGNFERYVNNITPLMNEVRNQSAAVGPSTRDFTPVSRAYINYDDAQKTYQLEIWGISSRISSLFDQISRLSNDMNRALNNAIFQIEQNVDAEANLFKTARDKAMAARRYWDQEDGLEGYRRFYEEAQNIQFKLIPDFEALLSKVPGTDSVKSSVDRVNGYLGEVSSWFAEFPTYARLPASSTDFPYNNYDRDDRKYGTQPLFDLLKKLAKKHKDDTNNTMYIGELSYEHGGMAKRHKSHRTGIDADVDPVEIGNVGNANYKRDLAIAFAKRVIDAGPPSTVYYADNETIAAANEHAGREIFKYEKNHTNHFHIRV